MHHDIMIYSVFDKLSGVTLTIHVNEISFKMENTLDLRNLGKN